MASFCIGTPLVQFEQFISLLLCCYGGEGPQVYGTKPLK